MKIQLIRETFTRKSTIGRLLVDGLFYGWTLEDVDRHLETNPKAKIKGETAIPVGKYRVIINYSPRFKKPLPLLLNVPGFEGIRIHSGNYPKDTEGCILPGLTKGNDYIGDSKNAFNTIYARIKAAMDKKDEVWIEIKRKAA